MPPSSPTRPLLIGLAITFAAVTVFSWYALLQIHGVRSLQTDSIDRNRKNSLQLVRIQSNLNSLGLAMRDMAEGSEPYPLEAWRTQFDRIRFDLEDALKLEESLSPESRTTEQKLHLSTSLNQFWTSADQMFGMARESKDSEARAFLRTSLEPQQASLAALVARLLVSNSDAAERAGTAIQSIYAGVERNIYVFLSAAIITVLATSIYLIRANRQIFYRMAALSNQRRELAQQLIGVQEQVFHSVSRELHDEFGQILTAVGALLGRVERRSAPADSALRADVAEIRDIAQSALEKVRSLSQALHPSVLDDYGLEKAVEWYASQFGKQTGIAIRYEKQGEGPVIGGSVAIHVYRIVQEALNNVARHSRSSTAWVRAVHSSDHLRLEIGDRGIGLPEGASSGLGLVAMRERAAILHGTLHFRRPPEGGTLVVLDVPLVEEMA